MRRQHAYLSAMSTVAALALCATPQPEPDLDERHDAPEPKPEPSPPPREAGMRDLIGTRWRERDNRFVRIVEVVTVGQRIGRRTVTFNGKPGHPTRVTYGDASKFFRSFTQEPTQ